MSNSSQDKHANDLTHGFLNLHSYQLFPIENIKISKDNPLIIKLRSHEYGLICRPQFSFKIDLEKARNITRKWKLIHVIKIPVDISLSSYALVYENEEEKQIIVVYQAINLNKMLLENLYLGISPDHIPVEKNIQKISATICTFINDMKHHFPHHTISFTGNSISSWWADISIYCCNYILDMPNVRAVTFDAPGSIFLLTKLHSITEEKNNPKNVLKFNELNILTYLQSPHIINTISTHAGEVYTIFGSDYEKKDFPMSETKLDQWNHLLYEELMNIIGTFSPCKNHKSLYARKALKWPCLLKDNEILDEFPIQYMYKNIIWLMLQKPELINTQKGFLGSPRKILLEDQQFEIEFNQHLLRSSLKLLFRDQTDIYPSLSRGENMELTDI